MMLPPHCGVFCCDQREQPLQSPGYESPEACQWNKMLKEKVESKGVPIVSSTGQNITSNIFIQCSYNFAKWFGPRGISYFFGVIDWVSGTLRLPEW